MLTRREHAVFRTHVSTFDPENFDHFLRCYVPEDRYYEEDAPHDGILFIGLRD
jgi:hypothetical protein